MECLPSGLVRRWLLSGLDEKAWWGSRENHVQKCAGTITYGNMEPHCMLFHRPSCKDQMRFKEKKKTTQNSRTKNLHSQPLEKPLVGFLGFQKWKTISADQVERKNVLSMKTMKRSSSPHIRFSSSHPVIMPASFSMPSTGTAAFPGKDNFSTNVPLHS